MIWLILCVYMYHPSTPKSVILMVFAYFDFLSSRCHRSLPVCALVTIMWHEGEDLICSLVVLFELTFLGLLCFQMPGSCPVCDSVCASTMVTVGVCVFSALSDLLLLFSPWNHVCFACQTWLKHGQEQIYPFSILSFCWPLNEVLTHKLNLISQVLTSLFYWKSISMLVLSPQELCG